MLNKTTLFFFIFLQIALHSLRSQTVSVETLSDSVFANLRYTFLANQTGDSITIIFLVKDKDGNFVTGMANPKKQHEYFTALINKDQKEICKDFIVTEATIEKSPIPFFFSLVLDYSSSMKDRYKFMQSAAQQFINSLPKASFTRINFDDAVDLVDPIPTPNPKPVYRDDFTKYGKGTALIAAADQGIESLKNAQGARFVILFTDGQENSSGGVYGRASMPSELVKNALHANTPILALGFDIRPSSLIGGICASTGGQYFPIAKKEDIMNVFNQVKTSMFNRFYVIKAKCSDNPIAINVGNPVGRIKNTIIISTAPPFTDKTPFTIGLGRVQFNLGDSIIRDDQKENLADITDRIVARLKIDPTLKINIQGHASPESGTEILNQILSENRALAVYGFITRIIEKNYPQDKLKIINRIHYQGFGATITIYPVDSDLNPENRRVEIKGVH